MKTLIPAASTHSMLYALSQLAGFVTMAQITINQLRVYIPVSVQNYIFSKFRFLFDKQRPPEMTLVIEQYLDGCSLNEVFEASQIYLKNKVSPSNSRLNVSKARGDKSLSITVKKGEPIPDVYQGIELTWYFVCKETENKKSSDDPRTRNQFPGSGSKSYELRFLKIHKDVILNSYLSRVMEYAASVKESERVVSLQPLITSGCPRNASINFNHPSTFDTLAMDPTIKKSIMDDLDRFLDRKDYYKRVGKAWKRGYLLYGPPGTGKTSLIAAMANYLKFHVYDLELTSVFSNMSLRDMLVSTKSRSIIVIEDIDCTLEIENRNINSVGAYRQYGREEKKLTLSGLLNFIDGLWSSCGDQRILVFTTNFKDKIDPALLRPGRMDMHIHMSYLTPCGFRVLAKNYLGLESHPLFTQIEGLVAELEITPAMVAEQLTKCDNGDPEATLESVIELLENIKVSKSEAIGESVNELTENQILCSGQDRSREEEHSGEDE